MASFYQTYPDPQDALAYLVALGLKAKVGLDLVKQLAPFTSAAAAAWEAQSLWTPYLSSGGSEDRYFDPPQDTRFLMLGTGLLSATALTTGVGGGDAGYLQLAGQAYRFLPQNAPAQRRAYESVEFLSGGYAASGGLGYPFAPFGVGFASGPYGRAGSIKITGVWGRVLTPPLDVWQAVLERAVRLALPALHLAFTQGLVSWTEAGVTEQYNPDPLKTIRDSLTASWDDALAIHRRVILYA